MNIIELTIKMIIAKFLVTFHQLPKLKEHFI